ncbi:MAG: ABC transporter permease [Blastocatellia bacterium]
MPDWRKEIIERLAGLRLEPTREAEIVEELAQHFESLYAELRADGSTKEEACRALFEELNDSQLLQQELGRVERSAPIEPVVLGAGRKSMTGNLWQDLRYGFRMLSRNIGFSIVAVLTLGLGIGATTAIFSVVYATLFESMPFPNPDQLVMVWSKVEGGRNVVSAGDYLEWKRRSTSFQSLEAWNGGTFNVATAQRPEQVEGSEWTPGFFRMVGVSMFLGRDFLPEEGEVGKDHVVILGYRLWKQNFGANREIIGQQIRVNGEPYTVVGVLPPDQSERHPNQLSLPLAFKPEQVNHETHSILVMGRLKPDVSRTQAQAEMETIAGQLAQEHPQSNTNWSVSVEPLHNNFLPESTIRNLWLLLGAVAFLLMIACANVANLMLARGTARQKEVAVRAALGATRGRLFWQFLTESLVLAFMGGVLGVLLGAFITKAIVAIMPTYMLPAEADVRLSIPVLLFTLACTLLTGLLFGCAPAWRATNLNLNQVLKEGGRTGTGGNRNRSRKVLVVVEFALALTLLAGGGLALRSFWNLTRVDLGVRIDHVLTSFLPVPAKRFSDAQQIDAYYTRILQKIESVPGISHATVTTGVPLRGTGFGMSFTIVGHPTGDPSERPGAGFQMVTAGYFDTFGVNVIRGRRFTDHDTAGSVRVAMVNENLANRYFSDVDPLAQRIAINELIPGSMQIGPPVEWQIVGVFHNVRNSQSLREDYPEIYVPFSQSPWPKASVAVRATGDPQNLTQSIAAAVNTVDPDLPLAGVKTMEQVADESLAFDRFGMVLYGSFAVLALLLAAVGIYGVMAFSVSQRTHEIGLRMALGASRIQVFSLILREGAMLALIGSFFGLAGAYLVGRAMEATLYGVGALDVAAFGGVTMVLFIAALLACFFPARRASKVDPMIALRYE